MNTTRRLLTSLVIGHSSLVISSVVSAATDDASLRPIAFQNGINQQALSTETAELAKAITTLIDELQRNGFPIQSLSALTELSAQLNALGGTEMSQIAARLRKLGESAQADPRATATEAYVAQQAIENRLKNLARQISIQQLREETARRLERLITRQLTIQRETRAIAAVKADNERQSLLESDQSGIGEDLSTFFQTGETLLARLSENDAKPASPATGEPAAAPTFSERINGERLTTLSNEALAGVKGKRFPEAYARQDALIVELRKILQGILSSLPKEQRLASALQQVAALRQQEEANQQAAKPPTPEAAQAAADQAQNLANQVAPLSPEAAAALREAQQAMRNPQPPTNNQQQPPTPQQNQQAANQQSQTQQADPNTPTPDQQQAQAGQPQDQNAQQQQAQSPAAAALAAAEAALRNELAQAQQQNGQGQQAGTPSPQDQQGQQQAANQQSGQGQPQQPGQQQPGQNQQQQGQGQQAAQNNENGQPNPNQQPGNQQGQGPGDAQEQIAGNGPDSNDPAQSLGALRRAEREAFTALQGERYPAEYSAWVQQYWRNLAQEQ